MDPAAARGRVIVVGAGISGLSAAWRLRERGFEVTVLEARDRIGGKMAARESARFGLSHGASVLTTTYHELSRLAQDVGVGAVLVPSDAAVGLVRDGRVLVHGFYLADAMNASVADLFYTVTRLLGGRLYQVRGRMDFLARAIAERLDVRPGARVRQVRRVADGVRVSWEQAGAEHDETVAGCVLAVPAPVVPALHPELHPEVREIITDGLAQIDLISGRFALRRPPDERCIAIMAPSHELGGLATVVQEHLRSPDAVPAGKGLVVAFWAPPWCTARLEVADETLAAEMLDQVERVLPGIRELVEFTAIDRWSPANPDLRFGNHRLFARLDELADPADRITLAGDYTGLPLIEGCVISGRDAAARLARALA